MEKNCKTCEYQYLSEDSQPCRDCQWNMYWTEKKVSREEKIQGVKNQLFDQYCQALANNWYVDKECFEEYARSFQVLLNYLETVIKGEY